MKPRLTLVMRAYCHLCDDLRAGVARVARGYDVEIEEVDVDADPALEARWSELVPVLLAGSAADGRELCHHFLDEPRLTAWLHGAACAVQDREAARAEQAGGAVSRSGTERS